MPKGKRVALHHMITAGNRGYAAWRDGGFTIHDISDPAKPTLISRINWSPPFPGGTHTPLPLPKRGLAVVADEANAEKCAKGLFYTFIVDVRAPENPVPISTLPTPRERDFCSIGTFGPHNLHENRPGSFQSEETVFATYNTAGVRVFDIRDAFVPKEIAYWVPPAPGQAGGSAAQYFSGRKDLRHLRHPGGVDVCQRLERRHACAAIRRLGLIGIVRDGCPLPEHCKPLTRLQANLNNVLMVH